MGSLKSTIDKLDVHTTFRGFVWLFLSVFSLISLVTYNTMDDCLNVASDTTITNLCGKFGAFFADILMQYFGISSFLLLPFCFFVSIKYIIKRPVKHIFIKTLYTLTTTILLSGIFGCLYDWYDSFSFHIGGIVGKNISAILLFTWLRVIFVCITLPLLFFYLYGLFFSKDKQIKKIVKGYFTVCKKCLKFLKNFVALLTLSAKTIIKLTIKIFIFSPKKQKKQDFNTIDKEGKPQDIEKIQDKTAINKENTIKQQKDNKKKSSIFDVFKKKNKTQYVVFDSKDKSKEEELQINSEQKYVYPTTDLLKYIKNKSGNQSNLTCEENMVKLERVIREFGVNGKIVGYKTGPVVTLYEFQPQAGTKSSKVIGLADDIARMMKVQSVRISTITGRETLSIELPNAERSIVCFKQLIESNTYINTVAKLPLILGCNIFGAPVVADLATMPHLLIAGTTGSGKSVGINGMLLSLLYKLEPKKCRLIMIDPKMLEFSLYDGIPNLLMPVITEAKDTVLALKWVVAEMENRYRKMSEAGVRNIDGYNEKMQKQSNTNKETEKNNVVLPYIVVVIDEMADLMVVAGKEIEVLVQRLSQMARAAGIHLIMATQRPSVDVITGVIKANFPTRIAYHVTSKIDSRTILGEQGAEQLLGKGDMLYMIGGTKTQRVHGPLITDSEVEGVVNFLKENNSIPDYVSFERKNSETDDYDSYTDINNNGDEAYMYRQAIKIVLEEKKTSISYLQRKLRIGYNKAANFIEKMEEDGILSAPDHTGKRILLNKED